MPSLYLPYVNIALDAFGLLVMAILLLSCVNEHVKNRHGTSRSFIALLVFVIATLIADLLSWVGEGVKTISHNALAFTSELDKVTLPGTIEYLDKNVFSRNSGKTKRF